jgi:hypothetical protein
VKIILLSSLLYFGIGLMLFAISPNFPKMTILAEETGCGGEEPCPKGQTCVNGVCQVCDIVCNGECYPAGTSQTSNFHALYVPVLFVWFPTICTANRFGF